MGASTHISEVKEIIYKIGRVTIQQNTELRENILTVNISVDHIVRALDLVLSDGIKIDKIKINFPDSVELTEKFEYKTIAKSKGWS